MNKEQVKVNFRAAHATQLSKVADAQFNQMDAAAKLASERAVLRQLEKQFKEDMAAPDESAQTALDLKGSAKKWVIGG